jgi:hypothetical protein
MERRSALLNCVGNESDGTKNTGRRKMRINRQSEEIRSSPRHRFPLLSTAAVATSDLIMDVRAKRPHLCLEESAAREGVNKIIKIKSDTAGR